MESLILIAIFFYDKFLFFCFPICLPYLISTFSTNFFIVSTELILLFVVVKSYIVVTSLELANAEFITPGEFSLGASCSSHFKSIYRKINLFDYFSVWGHHI